MIVQLTQFTVSLETGLGPVDIDFILWFRRSENAVFFQETISFFSLFGLSKAQESKRFQDLGVFLHKNTRDLSEFSAFIGDRFGEHIFREVGEIFEINIGFGLITVIPFFKSHAFNYFAADGEFLDYLLVKTFLH